MKKITLFLSLAFLALGSYAQTSESTEMTKDQLISLLADEMCNCALEKDLSTLTENDLAMCMLPALGKYGDQLDKFGISLSSDAEMEKLGEKIGLKAAVRCPQIFAKFVEEELNSNDEYNEEILEESVVYTGEVKRVEVKDFVTLYIKYNGQTKKVFWMSEVESSVDIYNGFDQLQSKQVEFTLYEATLFDPKINDYRNFQILETLNIIE